MKNNFRLNNTRSIGYFNSLNFDKPSGYFFGDMPVLSISVLTLQRGGI